MAPASDGSAAGGSGGLNGAGPPRRLGGRERLLQRLVRLILHLFFRRVEVVGADRIPPDQPLLIAANHVNGLVDPLLILGGLPVVPRFLGKHTLFKNPFIAPFLALAGVLPVYRPRDTEGAAEANAAVFARCHEILAAGGSIALFPEGTSHSEPSLVPLRTGAARIVLSGQEHFPGLAPRLLPVGLTFEARGHFRSRALVEVGEPLDPAPEQELYAKDAVAAVRQLTARLDAALQAVTLNYGSWEEARLIGRAAEIITHLPGSPLPSRGRLAQRFALNRAFIEGYGELARRFPEQTAAGAAAVGAYDQLLTAAGVRDDQVVAAYALPGVAGFLARSAWRLLIFLPLALLGVLLNWPTYRLVGTLAARLTREADLPATYKLFGGLVLFPATWLAEAALAGWAVRRGSGGLTGSPWLGALAVALAAPLTAYAALRFDDARSRLGAEARAFVVLRSRGRLAAELKRRRELAVRAVEDLVRAAGALRSRPDEP